MSTEKLNRMLEFIIMPDAGECCVYRLIGSDEEVIYVGQTTNLESRIYSHLANGKDFSFFDYELCEKSRANETERDAIIKHNPKLNVLLPKTPEYKTVDQARKIIEDCMSDIFESEIDKQLNLIDVAFHRPQVKKMKFTYVKTADIDSVIKNIKLSEFIALGED